jgi:hypothetical protein
MKPCNEVTRRPVVASVGDNACYASVPSSAFCRLEVSDVKASREPAMDRCEPLARLSTFALALPGPTEADGVAQFERLGLLPAGVDEAC